VNSDADRLSGEFRVQHETAATAEFQLAQRRRELTEVASEERQIRAGLGAGSSGFVLVASTGAATPRLTAGLPAALAAIAADADRLQVRTAEAGLQLARARALFERRLLARRDLEAAEAASAALTADLEAARHRLAAALVEHRRKRDSAETAVEVADGNLAAGRAQAASLDLQIAASARLRASLEERLHLLEQKRAQLALIAPLNGTVYGEDLPRALGQYFLKGAEICRIADTHELLVQVQMAEQSLGDVSLGQSVRVKARAFPNLVFHGQVSKIGGASEMDGNGQRSYRVELTIQNPDGLLRPGMTVFTRIAFGRHMVAWLAAHKLKQALRPEMWML
jgi:multidrug resistance efflux pump